MWGDNGAECSHFSQLPSLFYIAQYAKGVTDEAVIKAKFKSFTGIDYDDFMKLDNANNIAGNEQSGHPKCPSKYMLYADCFNSFMDTATVNGAGEKYAAYAIGPVLLAKDARLGDYLHDSVSPAFDEDGYVPYEKNEGLFMEIPDARMFINLKRADGEVVRLIDYSSAGKTYTKESECAAWLER